MVAVMVEGELCLSSLDFDLIENDGHDIRR